MMYTTEQVNRDSKWEVAVRSESSKKTWEVGSNPRSRTEHKATSEHKAEQRHGIALIGQSDRGAKAAKPQH